MDFLLFATSVCPLVERWSFGSVYLVDSVWVDIVSDVWGIKFLQPVSDLLFGSELQEVLKAVPLFKAFFDSPIRMHLPW